MCGICGIVSSNNLPEGIHKLRKMGARLLHGDLIVGENGVKIRKYSWV